MRTIRAAVIAVFLASTGPVLAQQDTRDVRVLPTGANEKRVALVIGNGAYRSAPTLRNPAHDADGMAKALLRLGFDVTVATEAAHEPMRRAIQAFGAKAQGASISLVFYAGHAIQVDAQNYLLPVDSHIAGASDVEFQTIPLDLITRTLARTAGAKILILDACRNNPFRPVLIQRVGTARSLVVPEGLAKVDAVANTYVVFSTAPDAVALDGSGTNSPFTTALLRHIAVAAIDVQALMRRVRREVIEATKGTQTPWDQSSLVGDLFLAQGPGPVPSPDTSFQGIGPMLGDVRIGQAFRDVQARHPQKTEFEAEHEHATEYRLPLASGLRAHLFVDAKGTVRGMTGFFQSPSRPTLTTVVNEVLGPAGASMSDLKTLGDSLLLERGAVQLQGYLSDSQRQRNRGLGYAYRISVTYDSPIEQTKNSVHVNVNDETFAAGRKIYDKFREYDIDTLHVAKVALATDGPDREFHGLFSPLACRPAVAKVFVSALDFDRRQRWVFYRRGDLVFMRSARQQPGKVYTSRIVNRSQMVRTIDERPTALTVLDLENIEKPEDRVRVILSKSEARLKKTRLPGSDLETEVPVGGLQLVITSTDKSKPLGARPLGMRRCDDGFVHQTIPDEDQRLFREAIDGYEQLRGDR